VVVAGFSFVAKTKAILPWGCVSTYVAEADEFLNLSIKECYNKRLIRLDRI